MQNNTKVMKKILKISILPVNLLKFFVVLNLLTRIIFIFHPITKTSFDLIDIFKILFFGFISDVLVFSFISGFIWLYLVTLSNKKLEKPFGYIILVLLIALFLYIYSGKSILTEYGGVLPEIGLAFVGLKTILFGLLLFLKKYRPKIRLALYSITVFIFVLLIIQNAISEFFFWNEFGVRYNFIAVDYLVYTNEVIGNIMESYPVIPLFSGVGIFAILITYIVVKSTKKYLDHLPIFAIKIQAVFFQVIYIIIAIFTLPFLSKLENSENVFVNEIQANGLHKFYNAFVNSELDFFKFYETLSPKEIPTHSSYSFKNYKSSLPENKKNVVLITIESLSAEFMKHYGNTENITPFLDELAEKSMFFTNLYATGNRTVRGLEAVTMCIPPTPGESVVKRKDNKNKFTTGSVFKSKGYQVKYLYGGDAYFDNMRDFFGGNGYEIIDKTTFKPNEITFSNIWGVCDEDMANKAIKTMNEEAKTGKPFFNHWMTVSNHRPFTYPANKIDIPNDAKSRSGGVKYTDFALKYFFDKAKKQSWFKNTVFVIVADHCASSSGKTELPMDNYRIPAFIYAPEFIKPQKVNQLVSQIDLMPTTMAILNFKYKSKFFGENVFSKNYKPRAFIATYQDLGFIRNNFLTIISPIKKVRQYQLIQQENLSLPKEYNILYEEKLLKKQNKLLVNETISYYQLASQLLKDKKYNVKN